MLVSEINAKPAYNAHRYATPDGVDIAFYPLEFNLLINPDFPDITWLMKVVDRKAFNYLLND